MQLTKNEYVLVVDDQDSARELLAVQLLHFDYPTRVASDGEEALREVGGGYPSGLRESDIPLSARIVALTNAYDALTSVRPYKVAHDHAEAVRRIKVDRGKHFDPVIVDAFLGCEQQFSQVKTSLQRSAAEGAGSEPLTQALGV
ncbi:MAG: hypothetical protein IH936_13690 [Acidobacteria bacterium]|nr:hypothetical protein [Acidobacteriota bacterium]